ncbi:MAG: undecaprenyl-diphosphatase UppP [Rubrobacter sp.]|jgi:undecaprenyl-diphosphatase|nr:undecaprenyl-diphosphatase UppP [Rubrobacter sp.]
MSDLIEAILLGVVQGITEFLPISSSGHLLLGQYFLGMDQEEFGLSFDVVLHMGTLLAVVTFFWRDLWRVMVAFFRSLPRPDFSDTDQRLAYLLLLATVPASGIGFAFRDFFETGLRNPWVVVGGLTAFGILFIVSERIGEKSKEISKLTFLESLVIGIGQAISLLPGISRSGATITFGLFLGMRRTEAARFSFLMSIPITAGAGGVQLPVLLDVEMTPFTLLLFGIGFAVSAVTAYLSIKLLLAYFARYSMRVFAYYGFALSTLVALLLILGY